jgi:hypothetical protein
MARTLKEHLDHWIANLDTRISLAGHILGALASFTLPAWAVWAADIFSHYAPFSWVAAGFSGFLITAVGRLLWAYGSQIQTRAKYNARFIARSGEGFNPLDLTFERRRIFLEDFVLPSQPMIDGKTFIDCDIIGPANIYWHGSNQAFPIRPPVMDVVCLEAKNPFNNGIIVKNCIFRNCSFQRITVFTLPESYPEWKDNPNLNWIGIPPTEQQISDRQKLLTPPTATPPMRVVASNDKAPSAPAAS